MSATWLLTAGDAVVNLDNAIQIAITPEIDPATMRAATKPAYWDIMATFPTGHGVYNVTLKRCPTQAEATRALDGLGRNLELGGPPSFRHPTA